MKKTQVKIQDKTLDQKQAAELKGGIIAILIGKNATQNCGMGGDSVRILTQPGSQTFVP